MQLGQHALSRYYCGEENNGLAALMHGCMVAGWRGSDNAIGVGLGPKRIQLPPTESISELPLRNQNKGRQAGTPGMGVEGFTKLPDTRGIRTYKYPIPSPFGNHITARQNHSSLQYDCH